MLKTAIFTVVTGANNPFNGVDVGLNATIAFTDLDGDGDYDAFIGEYEGVLNYYENTGDNATAPAFTEQTGANNPFNSVDIGYYSDPIFLDIDSDGDIDTFIGELTGNINYYKNTGSLFITLNYFTANSSKENLSILLEWQTTSEINTAGFNIYRTLLIGGNYKKINSDLIAASGNDLQGSYYSFDDTGIEPALEYYYKLEEITIDGSSIFYGPIFASKLSSDLNVEASAGCGLVHETSAYGFEIILLLLLLLFRPLKRKKGSIIFNSNPKSIKPCL
ncbi:MAG: VCBS repeat-containing protein [Pseudomonadota bacterium]